MMTTFFSMPTPRLLLVLATALLGETAAAVQASDRLEADDYINLLRIDLRAEKAKLVVEALELSVAEAEVFLPIYRRYDELLSKLNAERMNELRRFTARYATIDDAGARALTARSFAFSRKRLALLEKFTRRIEKATSPRVAARFAQIEQQLLMLLDVQIAAELPLVLRSDLPEPEREY
jgi:CO/xanthine dehydrogenase Mo-binding subunit